ncbi:SDR family NAD(P)-dependent oxidoreductase [Leifsonia sp. H3M29-4]|uniref:SDR family NAD(P)-dependent oxidoreductase n=1 Tax=Salinibacterium metalliresistens TaxID=3031321 RepID=UPI0023DC42B3|nr:SDR family NAD(P)-dependent oxidoreductase [Salinibacterium metalliresistens]MDF1479285.1 SDR family NAD(P)-dependent oxidoreductase [Salinibacterium metalliresistens]
MTTPSVTNQRLLGKRIIVTGGARGIGGEIAARFAVEGARVGILDRLAEQGSAHADTIGGSFFEVDLLDPVATAAATQAAVDALGGVDVLVNCAGILRFGSLLEVTVQDWNETFSINTRAMLTTMQVCVRSMLDAGHGGKIVNLASMAAKKGGAGEGAYPASKAAVVALTRQAALEWGVHGITANSICPGYILTEMGAATRTDAMVEEWSSYSPLGRLGETKDVAAVALFLASEDSDYLTGQAINVTGGMVMH